MASEREDLAIVITGCDSGFGRALALELLSRGYTVFALGALTLTLALTLAITLTPTLTLSLSLSLT